MVKKNKTWLWWSSGKDSAWALHTLRKDNTIQLDALVTSVNINANRVAMHAVRYQLLEAQASALGLPVHIIEIPYPCPNGAYERAAQKLIQQAEAEGVTHMAFGDLFLEDVRAYRENLLKDSSIECLFPLWQKDTAQLAQEMIAAGLSAYLSCIDPKVLSPDFVGRPYDQALLDDLPASVDPCGENGEFHTFVNASPDFAGAISVKVGERVERDGFYFADIVPIDE